MIDLDKAKSDMKKYESELDVLFKKHEDNMKELDKAERKLDIVFKYVLMPLLFAYVVLIVVKIASQL